MKASTVRKRRVSFALGFSGAALAAALVLPAIAQESLLPEGFGSNDPAPKSAPTPKQSSAPTPKSTSPAPSAPSTGQGSTAPFPSASSAVAAPTPTARAAADEEGEELEEGFLPSRLKYDLPPGTRRALTRIGPLPLERGGFAPNALGPRGEYASLLMRATSGDLASRWAHILLRRALVSAMDTPDSVNGADLAAERAALLVRMGESIASRWLVQSVDYDRATKTMVAAAQQSYLASADPAGLCSYVPAGLSQGNEHVWRLTAGFCAAFSGEAGPAGWAISRVRSSGRVNNFDILLAERVLGATGAGRRSTTIEWSGVDTLTDWRFGLATATGVAIPENLMTAAPRHYQAWATLAPMTDMEARITYAKEAAARGVISNGAYVSLLSSASAEQEPSEGLAAHTALVRDALGAGSANARYAGMKRLWESAANARDQYAAMVLTARAAASLPLGADVDDDPWQLIGSMLASGFDRNASAWISKLDAGSRAWGLMAVGADRPISGVSASTVEDFADDDDSAGQHRSKLLLAALAGLDRLPAEAVTSAARQLDANLTKQSRWTRAITEAADRQEPAMVALLVGVGMQGDWAEVPAYHLYHITRALKSVGLEAEARMIAAEALVRV